MRENAEMEEKKRERKRISEVPIMSNFFSDWKELWIRESSLWRIEYYRYWSLYAHVEFRIARWKNSGPIFSSGKEIAHPVPRRRDKLRRVVRIGERK